MKKVFISLSIFLSIVSCGNLEENPYSFFSIDSLYQDESDVDAAIFGIYESQETGLDDLWYFLATSGPGESVLVRLKGDGAQGRLSSVDFIPTDAQGHWWDNFYTGINRANTVLENVYRAGLETDLEEQKVAEAKFLRAFFYFNLVKWFGEVPLQMEQTTDFSDESIKKPRNSIEEVYNVIVEDLKFAETRLPVTWSASNWGRATSGAAKALLGKVYLNMAGKPLEKAEMYSMAAKKFKEIVDNGNYSLQPDFADIFSIENEMNSELIFVRKDIRLKNAGTVLTFMTGVPNSPYAFNGGQYQIGFSEQFYNSFDPIDLRRDVTLLYTYVDRTGNAVTYNDPNNPPLPYGGYTDPYGIGFGKLKDPNASNPFAHDNDLIYIRYADVLLMLAESLNEIGDSSGALPYLNQVRNRAGLADVNTTNQSNLKAIIKQERKWELAGEFQEYPDLQRWGDLEASLQNNEDAAFYGTVYDPRTELMPIPQTQLDANENLVQNPGY